MTSHTTELQQLYVAYFSRPADPGGLAYYQAQLDAGRLTLAEVSRQFSTSPEYTATFAGLSTTQIVARIYINLFGHPADSAGLAYWTGLIDKGLLTPAFAVTSIAGGAQGADLAAFNAKVSAAVAFTDFLGAVDGGAAAYAGGTAIGRAADYLRQVYDDATLKAATTPEALAQTLGALNGCAASPSDLARWIASSLNSVAVAQVDGAVAANEAYSKAQVAQIQAVIKAASGAPADLQGAFDAAMALSAAAGKASSAVAAAISAGSKAAAAAASFVAAAAQTVATADDALAAAASEAAKARVADAAALSAVLSSAQAYGAAAGDAVVAASAATRSNLAAGKALAEANSVATAKLAVDAAAAELNQASSAVVSAQHAVELADAYVMATLASSTGVDDAAGAQARTDAAAALAAANTALDAAKAHVATAAQLPTGQQVTTHGLTLLVDIVTGGAGADLFNAVPDSSGVNPLNAYDTLDGGAGEDILNIVLPGVVAIPVTATIRNIETIHVAVAADTTVSLGAAVSGVTTLSIIGSGNVSVALGANNVALVDASGLAGGLTVATAASSAAAATIKGGAGSDLLTANHAGDVLQGGAGADILVARADSVILTGGAGADIFDVASPASKLGAYTTITDLGAGDSLRFGASAASFQSAKVAVGGAATLQDAANAAIAGSADGVLSWFQFQGDTYVVQNGAGAGTSFNATQDSIVKILGLVDLGAASFSAASHSLGYVV
ncbi:DUF4214 domain-containing protein [Oxalobacteraceae bacterium A2-2]